jgi:hypothetical protein
VGEQTNAYKFPIGKSEGMRQAGRSKRTQWDNIKMDSIGIGWESVDWIRLI